MMNNNGIAKELPPDIPAAGGDGNTRRPWHTPALKELRVSRTLANFRPGTTYDYTHYVSDS